MFTTHFSIQELKIFLGASSNDELHQVFDEFRFRFHWLFFVKCMPVLNQHVFKIDAGWQIFF